MTAQPSGALRAVEEIVQAVVDRDTDRLAGAVVDMEVEYLYYWTRDYGDLGEVELVMPPGPPDQWDVTWTDMDDGGKHVAVGMWTREEGRSDLTLELHLHPDGERWTARILNLHVL